MDIRNNNDLRIAYGLFSLIERATEQATQQGQTVDPEKVKATVDGIKRDIRRYYREQDNKPAVTYIYDEAGDSYISLYELPETSDPEGYFEECERLTINSPYDCTGRPFTMWYKIFRRHGRLMVYHCIGIDC